MPFEGAPPAAVPERLEMVAARLGRGSYTDDTQMAIALAESLLDRGGVDELALGRAFADAHDPSRGYGSGTTEVLRLVRAGVHPREAARLALGGQGSFGNGAAMRIAPVAVSSTPATTRRWLRRRERAPVSPTPTRSGSTPRSPRRPRSLPACAARARSTRRSRRPRLGSCASGWRRPLVWSRRGRGQPSSARCWATARRDTSRFPPRSMRRQFTPRSRRQ